MYESNFYYHNFLKIILMFCRENGVTKQNNNPQSYIKLIIIHKAICIAIS